VVAKEFRRLLLNTRVTYRPFVSELAVTPINSYTANIMAVQTKRTRARLNSIALDETLENESKRPASSGDVGPANVDGVDIDRAPPDDASSTLSHPETPENAAIVDETYEIKTGIESVVRTLQSKTNRARDATHAMCGFFYQVYQTVRLLLQLKENDEI